MENEIEVGKSLEGAYKNDDVCKKKSSVASLSHCIGLVRTLEIFEITGI